MAGGITVMTDGLNPDGLYRLMTWLSPGYPIGAFSYSHGLEYAVEAGTLRDAATLETWLGDLLRFGSGRSDAVLFRHAFEAAERPGDLAEVAALAAAFAEATADAWPCAALDRLAACWEGPLAYPVVVAVAAAGHGLDLSLSLRAYLHGFSENLVSAGVRLIPLGQRAGQRVLAALEAPVAAAAAAAITTPLENLGGAALLADLASMKHETQYTRLFRS